MEEYTILFYLFIFGFVIIVHESQNDLKKDSKFSAAGLGDFGHCNAKYLWNVATICVGFMFGVLQASTHWNH